MASTMRSLARNLSIPKPETIEKKQENLTEPAVVMEVGAVETAHTIDRSQTLAPEINSANETCVIALSEELEPISTPALAQPSNLLEKKSKAKSSSKKSKTTDQKKVNKPKVETET